MGKYFGTDGVRGVANAELTPEFAFKLGRVGGYVLTKGMPAAKVVVGRDTRVSGQMLEGSIVSGLLSVGIEVIQLGVISTPGVAFLTKELDADAGIMISASHNPVQDNGIKFFGPDGFKLLDVQEEEIERLLDQDSDDLPRPTGSNIGKMKIHSESGQKYLDYLQQTIAGDLKGLNIALDCAHGATSFLAPQLFRELGAEVSSMGNTPDGFNINEGVGSTHPEALASFVQERGCDFGLSFDGDGDRLIAIDEKGKIVDGDKIMYICANFLKKKGNLQHNTVVSTVMSNLGFYKALEVQGIQSATTGVGDRYVMEELRKSGFNLGGEQSGHIIFLDYITTGDGMLAGLQLANVIRETGKSLSDLAGEMQSFPQVLKNVRVTDKAKMNTNMQIQETIYEVEKQMAGNGRVLVRPSGTEPLVRVMVEAQTEELALKYVQQIVDVVEEEIGLAKLVNK
ncbi:phosphoglucosamine mutase [Halalkalibacter okhensis]|uniref:Phosphoglucosamine mutase n=1 Tax=Halalkalibacter okhensis TaxID=333138 RepID=A0A0B0IAE8_9BACI|nr:phosphoglucosamine mutase [Halalkalibacter okhensis]KHF38250.1 phosphoglucosamine mutase [Halalkalibacter okhensis]